MYINKRANSIVYSCEMEGFSRDTDKLLNQYFLKTNSVKVAFCSGERGLGNKTAIEHVMKDSSGPTPAGQSSLSFRTNRLFIQHKFYLHHGMYTEFSYCSQDHSCLKVGGNAQATANNCAELFLETSARNLQGKIVLSTAPEIRICLANPYRVRAELGVNPKSFSMTVFNLAAEMLRPGFQFGLKHESPSLSLGTLTGSCFYTYDRFTHLAGRVKYSAGDVEICVGAEKRVSPDTTVKFRFDSEGGLGVNMKNRLNEYLTLISTVKLNVNSVIKESSAITELALYLKIS